MPLVKALVTALHVGTADDEIAVTTWEVQVPPGVMPLILVTVVARVPAVVTSPERSPFVIVVEPLNFVRLFATGLPVVVTAPPAEQEPHRAAVPLEVKHWPLEPIPKRLRAGVPFTVSRSP